ncbi:hypothetical protein V8Z80_07065 [Orrella sp. JC864]|uniref:hypothetical protein n=1 Tax=Orrella sp. JC864 TaxID=3120298 RepID=UPI00300ABDAC
MCRSEAAQALAGLDGAQLSDALQALASRLEDSVAGGPALGLRFEAVQAMFSALCAVYGADAERLGRVTPLAPGERSNSTNVLIATTGLLRGANLELFELGMWQSWSGMK